jgi:hypothetical protein
VQEPVEMHTCDPDKKAVAVVAELWSGLDVEILRKISSILFGN